MPGIASSIGSDRIIGPENGPVVVLLHALLLDNSIFRHQAETLASQGFRVFTPNYAGHGGSTRVAGEPSVKSMAEQVFAELEQLRLDEPIILGGLSMGGYVSFAAWEHYRDRIRGLMLIDTRAVPDTAEEAANRYRASDLIRQAGSVGPLAATMLPRLLSKTTVGHKPHVWHEVAKVLEKTPVESACDALAALATRPDRRRMLGSINVPTLVLVGEEDIISPPAEMREIAAGISGSRFVAIPGAGHLATVESPEPVTSAMLQFLHDHF